MNELCMVFSASERNSNTWKATAST